VATPAMMFLVYTTHAVSWIPAAKLVNRNIEFVKGKKQNKSSNFSYWKYTLTKYFSLKIKLKKT